MGGPGSGGANRKSATIRVLNGSDGHHPERRRAGRPCSSVVGDPPERLAAAVADVWRELAPAIRPPIETAAGFEVLCTELAAFRAQGATAARLAVLRGLLSDFGLTAAARARLGVEPAPASSNPFAQFRT